MVNGTGHGYGVRRVRSKRQALELMMSSLTRARASSLPQIEVNCAPRRRFNSSKNTLEMIIVPKTFKLI
jgi:hypothetical protein